MVEFWSIVIWGFPYVMLHNAVSFCVCCEKKKRRWCSVGDGHVLSCVCTFVCKFACVCVCWFGHSVQKGPPSSTKTTQGEVVLPNGVVVFFLSAFVSSFGSSRLWDERRLCVQTSGSKRAGTNHNGSIWQQKCEALGPLTSFT